MSHSARKRVYSFACSLTFSARSSAGREWSSLDGQALITISQALITISTGSLEGWPLLAKRLLDLVGSALLLVLLAPVLLATVLLIKVTSPGPVYFVQQRLGQNKRLFRIYKFRTMVQGADQMQKALEHLNEVDGAAFKIKDDPRITPVGKLLGKTSIDELPQLFNVLKGDMSLVGPRAIVGERLRTL